MYMCWNKEISANTFLFSTFVLCMIMYNNTYTQYKILHMNPYLYIFFFSIILMQLIEYFIWKYINHSFYNRVFSFAAFILLFIQPLASSLLIRKDSVKRTIQIIYLIIVLPIVMYIVSTHDIHTSVGSNKHLIWNFSKNKMEYVIGTIIWTFFFLFPLFYEKYYWEFCFGLMTFLVCLFLYNKYHTVESMWCWIVNSIFLYYAFYLLLYLPFFSRLE